MWGLGQGSSGEPASLPSDRDSMSLWSLPQACWVALHHSAGGHPGHAQLRGAVAEGGGLQGPHRIPVWRTHTLSLRVIYEEGPVPFLQFPLDSLEGSSHFILFLNHQIVLHPEQWSWDLKVAASAKTLITEPGGGCGALLSPPLLRWRTLCPSRALFPWPGFQSDRESGLVWGRLREERE